MFSEFAFIGYWFFFLGQILSFLFVLKYDSWNKVFLHNCFLSVHQTEDITFYTCIHDRRWFHNNQTCPLSLTGHSVNNTYPSCLHLSTLSQSFAPLVRLIEGQIESWEQSTSDQPNSFSYCELERHHLYFMRFCNRLPTS